jgi:predicted AAA+ superfamily ATPase
MKISPSNTLLIFDEAQEVPRVLTSLKYFYEDLPEYHIATAGSLLGIFLHKDTSFPVGKVNTLKVEPMDFEEFLWVNGRENIATFLKSNPFETTFNEFNGFLAEQYVLQQLAKYTLFYWTGTKLSEIDFVMQYGSEIVPIEVKSGTNVKAKSLKLFRDIYLPKVSVRFSLKDTRLDNNLLNISLYNSFLCEQLLDYSL